MDIPSQTPFIDLHMVELRARQRGSETLRLNAGQLVLYRDLRTVSVDDITNGVGYKAGRPVLTFAAGHADILAGIGPSPVTFIRLNRRVTATTSAEHIPLHVTTDGLDWSWPSGPIQTRGEVDAIVGSLGRVQCARLDEDPTAKAVTFGAVSITTNGVGSIARLADATSAAIPAPAAPPATAQSGDADMDDSIHINAPQGGRWDEQGRTLTIHGPVTFRQGDATMETVGAIYDNTTKVAHALSPVKITDKTNTLTGNQGSVDFHSHIATIDQNVTLTALPTGPPAKNSESIDEQAKQPTTMTCDHMTYDYRTKLADASGNLKITQPHRIVTATTGHYDANLHIITLNGDVDARSDDGRDLKTPTARVSVAEGDEWIELPGPIQADFTLSDDDNPLPKGGKGGKKGAKGKPAAPAAAPAHSTAPTATSAAANPPTPTPSPAPATPTASTAAQ
jgi:hypothetical protein